MATSLGAIAAAIDSYIVSSSAQWGLSADGPRGTSISTRMFTRASGQYSWENRPAGDIDREFTVSRAIVIDPMTIGRTKDQLFTGSFQITVGHSKMKHDRSGYLRRDKDIEILCRNVIWYVGVYGGDVCLINKTNESVDEREEFFITTLTFEVLYVGTAIGQ